VRRTLKRVATSKLFIAALLLIGLYALAGFFLAPYLIERYAPKYAEEKLGAQASIGRVRFNPFLFTLEARDISLREPEAEPIVAVARLLVDLELSSLIKLAWTFAEVRLEGLNLHLEIARNGNLNLAALVERLGPSKEGPPRMVLQHVVLTDSQVSLTDLTGAAPASTSLHPINMEIFDLATLPDREGRYTVAATLPEGGTLAWRGGVSLRPLASDGELHLTGLRADTVWKFYRDRFRLEKVAGALTASARYDYSHGEGEAKLRLEEIVVHAAGVELVPTGGSGPMLMLEALDVTEGRFDLASRELVLPKVALRNGRVAPAINADGTLDIQLLANQAPASKPPAPAPPSTKVPAPWRASIGALQLDNIALQLTDRSYQPALAYRLEVVSATLKNIASAAQSPMMLEAQLRGADAGTIAASGTIAADGENAEVLVKVEGLALKPFQPVLARYAALDLKSGALSATARVSYQSKGEQSGVRANGEVTVSDALLNETASGDRFLSWKTLSAAGVSFATAPSRLVVREISILEPGAKLVISKERHVNVTQILKKDSARADSGRGAAEASAATAAKQSFDARVGRIRFRNGVVDYADQSLVLPFATRVSAVNGTIVGVSTQPSRRAQVKAGGEIPPYGSASVEGALIPSNPKQFLDLHVLFKNVAIPPLSPYTATFAGRTVDAGNLWLDLDYKIVDGQLLGENKIQLADFKLGQRVEAPNALDLPLDLAVALLTDAEGRINLAVPVRGAVDKPTFEVGALIREAIVNVLQRIVSAPFRALAHLFGSGGGDRVADIDFDPGSAALAPQEREKLAKVAEALKQRPQLKLVVNGPYAPKRDGEALRAQRVRIELAEALGDKLAPGEDPGPIAYGDAKTQRQLERLLTKYAGEGAVEAFASRYKEQAGKKADRVNPALALIGRASPDQAFYQALFDQLVARYPLSDGALQALAGQRVQTIVDYLIRSAGADAGRVAAGETRSVEDPSGSSVSATLKLDVIKSAS
jgi:hypothetical protein